MDSSSSAQVNNIFLNFNVTFFVNILKYSAGVTVVAVLVQKIVNLIIEQVFKKYHYKWLTVYKDKRLLAKYVISRLVEGQSGRYDTPILTEAQKESIDVGTQIEAYDIEFGSQFRTFIGMWALLYNIKHISVPEHNLVIHEKSHLDLVAHADKNAEWLRKKANKWIK